MNLRTAAAGVLTQVAHHRKSLTLALEPVLAQIDKDNDRAFVQALCFGALRWYWRLDRILAGLLRKPINDPEIHHLAILGLYQLIHTRVRPHAAVAETVAGARHKPWAKPLLNALLRNYQRGAERIEAQLDSADPLNLAHPVWLHAALVADWPEQLASLVAANNQQPPLSLRVNLSRVSRDVYLARLAAADLPARPGDFAETAVILDSAVGVGRLPGFWDGDVSVQDEAAQLAARLLDSQPGQRVLDLCAAPGGKTLHILEHCPDLAELVAIDLIPERLDRIGENLRRVGAAATLKVGDATEPATWWDGGLFDRILLDAPCSATGVIRRHPDIKLLRTPAEVDAVVALQDRILAAAWPLLKPGGRLVYATCSVFKRENEQRIEAFLGAHRNAGEIAIDASWGRAATHGRQILSGEASMDGFFYACLEKRPI